ncbi:MAG: cation:proton antiporter [Acidimicrobiales bacterium]
MISTDPYESVVLVVGFAALVAAVLPAIVAERPVSVPMIMVTLGAGLHLAVGSDVVPDATVELEVTERLTEFGVLVSLMAAGLAIDRPIGWRRWSTTWRLLGIAMPLGIAATTLLGIGVLGLPLASALLLGAVLAPTDPVLAREVQVGEPTSGGDGDEGTEAIHDEVLTTLTSEAGLNDALAFPFVYAAILLVAGSVETGDVVRWFAVDLIYRVAAGAVVGVVVGWLVGRLAFLPPRRLAKLSEAGDGFVGVATLLTAYAAAEAISGYGFLAVFAAGVTVRSFERHHDYHRVLHRFVEQLEHVLVVIIVVLFGASLTTGVLEGVALRDVLVAVAVVLVVRPAVGLVALIGSGLGNGQRATIAFFGIKGIGSIFYLAYALSTADFAEASTLWTVVALSIVLSLFVHGTLAAPVLRWLGAPNTSAAERE